MINVPFSAQIRQQTGLSIIDLHGEVNNLADQQLNEAYQEVVREDPKTIVLNFSNVTYINSTGIALIVGLLAEAHKAHRRLVVYGLSDHYLEIFNITRLSDFMTIYADETSLLSELK